jgi:hypothetical protein
VELVVASIPIELGVARFLIVAAPPHALSANSEIRTIDKNPSFFI